MAPMSPAAQRLRQRHNALKRFRTADDPAVVESARDLRAERLAEHVGRIVAQFPPLTDEQLDRVAGLLTAGRRATTNTT